MSFHSRYGLLMVKRCYSIGLASRIFFYSVPFNTNIKLRLLSGVTCNPIKGLQDRVDPSVLWRFRQGKYRIPVPSHHKNSTRTNTHTSNPDENKNKKKLSESGTKLTLWQRAKDEITHYYNGFRLLGLELKIAAGICFRLLRGHTLTRRERKQLVRTVADIIRLVPFVVFIIVPFMEFLLPFYLKFFPFMLPSTFKDKNSEADKIQQRLKAKLELTRFLQETLQQTTSVSKKTDAAPTVSEFHEFLKKVQESGQPASNEDIKRFSKLFEDQVTLDSLEIKQLKMLCQLLSLPTIGPSNLLRFQIWMRVRQLKAEDCLIAQEGVNNIPTWELQNLCQDRGMRSAGLTEERLRSQLSQWLALHLEQNVPVTLLLFSRALHVTKPSDTDLPLKEAIAQLPPSASEEVTARVLETTPTADVDLLTKIEVLKKEQAGIKAARAQRKQEEKQGQKVLVESKSATVESQSHFPANTMSKLMSLDSKGLVDAAPSSAAPSETLRRATDNESPALVTLHGDTTSQPLFSPVSASVVDDKLTRKDQSVSLEVPMTPGSSKEHGVRQSKGENVEISVDDLAQIESAIVKSMPALDQEALEGLKEKVAETEKELQKHEASLETGPDTAVDKKTSKAAARLSARVSRLIGEMDGLVDKLQKEQQTLLKHIETQESNAQHSTEPTEKTAYLKAIEADQQRMIDINDLVCALRQIQNVPDDLRWQKILEALDEDSDGKIELQHVLSAIELLGAEKVKLSFKEVKRLLETFDKEELVEKIESAHESTDVRKLVLSKRVSKGQRDDSAKNQL